MAKSGIGTLFEIQGPKYSPLPGIGRFERHSESGLRVTLEVQLRRRSGQCDDVDVVLVPGLLEILKTTFI